MSVQQDNGVSCYSHILLSDTNRIVAAGSLSRSCKRNDSCVEFYDYLHSTKYGLIEKIVLSEQSGVFAVIKSLSSASIQLCQDPITHAKLPHIHAFKPTRYMYIY